MSEQNWYIHHNENQLGPFGAKQVQEMIDNKMISSATFLYKVGWKDWQPLSECLNHFNTGNSKDTVIPTPAVPQEPIDKRTDSTPRATVSGRIIVHNNEHLTVAKGVNISTTGIFIETQDKIFNIGEKLKLSVRLEAFDNSFNIEAYVIRFSSNPDFPVGYGLRFKHINQDIKDKIQHEIDILNNFTSSIKKSS